MKKIYIAMAVLGTMLLSSCVQEKNFSNITVGENEIAFVMQGVSTRSAEERMSNVTRGITIPLGVSQGEALYLEETIEELNPSPATKGAPAYTVTLPDLYPTLGVYAAGNFGDVAFQMLDTEQFHDAGWRYNHNYDGNPWPNETDKVHFYLRMPSSNDAVSDYEAATFKLTSPENGLNQADLLFGHVLMSKEDHDKKLPGGMPVTMKHALTGIKFANGHPNDNPTKTIITKVELIGLNTYGEGTIGDDGYVTWSGTPVLNTEENPFYLEFDNPEYVKATGAGNPDGTVSTTGNKKWDDNLNGTTWVDGGAEHNLNHTNGELTFWFIPQAISDDLILKVYFTVKTPDSVDGFLTDACHTIELGKMLNEKNKGTLTWAAGQLRTYTLKPYDVDVDIADVMSDADTKEDLHIANTGNVDEYVRMLIMGNWYGWTPDQDPEKDDPSILVGYKYKGDETPTPSAAQMKEMVLPWFREGYDLDNNPSTPNVDPYGSFDSSFLLAKLGSRDGKKNDWADASGGYYYTMPIGPGAGVGDAVQSATKDLFESYHVTDVPHIYLETSAGRVEAVGVHLRMEIVVQAIAVPKDDDGNNVWWLQAWYDATGVDKLDPADERNEVYRLLYESGEYDVE